MKRLILLTAVLAASFGFTSAAKADETAAVETDPTLLNYTASTTNDLLGLIPALSGPDTRHICFIFSKLDKSYCVYIPLP